VSRLHIGRGLLGGDRPRLCSVKRAGDALTLCHGLVPRPLRGLGTLRERLLELTALGAGLGEITLRLFGAPRQAPLDLIALGAGVGEIAFHRFGAAARRFELGRCLCASMLGLARASVSRLERLRETTRAGQRVVPRRLHLGGPRLSGLGALDQGLLDFAALSTRVGDRPLGLLDARFGDGQALLDQTAGGLRRVGSILGRARA
jgi:hypothetical protein